MDVQGDSFDAEFKITSWSATNTDSTITSEGMAERVSERCILPITLDQDLVITLREILMVKLDPLIMTESWLRLPPGIWKREGKIVNMYTLDTFSDGGMIYAEGKVDLVEGTLKFKAFEF